MNASVDSLGDVGAEEPKALAGGQAHARVVLADAGREHDAVDATHGRGVGADELRDVVAEDVEGLLGALVATVGLGLDVTEVARDARDAQHARLLVEDLVDLAMVESELFLQKAEDERVDVAAARAHWKAGARGEAHRRVDGNAAVDGGDGGAVAEVAGHELELGERLAHELGGTSRDIAVRGAVEAVAAHGVLLEVLVGKRVEEGLGGHGLVERRVEDGDLRDVGAHELDAALDAVDLGAVVERRELDEALEAGHRLGRHENRGLEVSAVGHAVTGRVNLGKAPDDAVLGVSEGSEDGLHGLLVRGHGHVRVEGNVTALVNEVSIDADALAKALGQHRLRVVVDELVLERRAACVNCENLHVGAIPFLLAAPIHSAAWTKN